MLLFGAAVASVACFLVACFGTVKGLHIRRFGAGRCTISAFLDKNIT